MNPPTSRTTHLSPTPLGRARTLLSGGGWRSLRVRRSVAVLLVLGAALLVVVDQRRPDAPALVVAAVDLRPGEYVTDADVATAPIPTEAAPDGALVDTTAAIGRRVTGPIRRGEVLTDQRLLTSRLPAALTGNRSARLVPVRPADESVASLVRQGDLVDVLDADARVLARDAVVAAAPQTGGDSSTAGGRGLGGSPPILLAVDGDAARRVAATGLGTPLALILH
ncbi:SAF domain-containing protein [Gordonia shandongensis]|uniref:SAF domain-containing protein n=1 Tax=Gordonia shandongensis TaxID=376351 RepID=UPI00040CDFED|nr:SAF domain-containing protein [Gordonia shandongensis]